MGKHTILFLAANPSGTNSLALDREARAIQVELERSRSRDSFEFVTRWAAEPVDLLRELRKLRLATRHGGDLQVHQLVARFVRARAPLGERVRQSLFDGLLTTAPEFCAHPGDLERRAVMLAHSPNVEDWAALVTGGSQWQVVGNALVELGQFVQALPWFECAVAAKEKGDVYGRVDPESLGRSLHQVGFCYTSEGQFAQALPWFERAVAAKEKGDVHGRVDPESLRTTREALTRLLNASVEK